MEKILNNLPYFHSYLVRFLMEYHPDKVNDKRLIRSLSDKAENYYQELIYSGTSHHIALELAHKELVSGLEFSLYNHVFEIVCEDFPEIPAESRRKVCMSVLPSCKEIMKNFLEDDLPENIREWAMNMEITGTIQLYLEEKDGI